MAWIASITGALSVIGGLLLSWFANSPVGPSIVLLAGIFFLNAMLASHVRKLFSFS
jgi:zinc transport system permease protein